ncbi:MAG: phage tail protein [Bacteroidetes bacterium]|nr:phage tail protein [Bacteroidota bacterium]MBU1720220.1 phage tail protein [Bacteroidota bacterium]
MADRLYPVPTFNFEIAWTDVSINCSSIEGFGDEVTVIEGRDGKSNQFFSAKRPGIHNAGEFTVKNAVFKNQQDMKNWFDKIATRNEDGYAETITITLKDENHNAVTVWNVNNALITKYEMPDMNAATNEPAIQSITICSSE